MCCLSLELNGQRKFKVIRIKFSFQSEYSKNAGSGNSFNTQNWQTWPLTFFIAFFWLCCPRKSFQGYVLPEKFQPEFLEVRGPAKHFVRIGHLCFSLHLRIQLFIIISSIITYFWIVLTLHCISLSQFLHFANILNHGNTGKHTHIVGWWLNYEVV